MPPDVADDLRSSQFQFEKAMSKLKKITSGIRRDLPVEIDVSVVVPQAKVAWEEGRLALNSYFEILNSVTGLKGEMVSIPPSGLNQVKVGVICYDAWRNLSSMTHDAPQTFAKITPNISYFHHPMKHLIRSTVDRSVVTMNS